MEKFSYVIKVPGGYRVVSEKGKNLGGPYKTRGEAEKRLEQVERFKHMNKKEALDALRRLSQDMKLVGESELSDKISCAISALAGTKKPKTDCSYTSIMRELRDGDDECRLKFQKTFKHVFDSALNENLENPTRVALLAAMKAIDYA